jgi:hypothetical protein
MGNSIFSSLQLAKLKGGRASADVLNNVGVMVEKSRFNLLGRCNDVSKMLE